MKKKLCALLLAAAMFAVMAPAALAEKTTAETDTETVAETVLDVATPEQAEKAETEIDVDTLLAQAEAEGKVPMTVDSTDVDFDTFDAPYSLSLPSTITVKVGETVTIHATAYPGDYATSLRWSITDSRIASISGSTNNNCIIRGEKPGAENLYVYSTENPSAAASCRVIVSGSLDPIRDVNLSETDITMIANSSHVLTATLVPSDTTDSKELRWGSDNTAIVTVDAGSDGKCTLYSHSYGTTNVWVKTSNDKYRSCKVTVGIPIDSVSLDQTRVTINFNQTLKLNASVWPTNTTLDRTIKWTSDNVSVATVDGNGYVTGHAAGGATIVATTVNGKTATCAVQVTPDLTKVKAFVTRLYKICLDREPDTTGFPYWVGQLTSGQSTGTQVAYGFVSSNEFRGKNLCNKDYLKSLYRAFLGRESDGNGLNYWLGRMAAGDNREAVFNGFAQSNEFGGICTAAGIKLGDPIPVPAYGTVPTGPCSVCGEQDGVTQFVTRMYQVCLGRKPDATGLRDWTNSLWNHSKSGRDVGIGFIYSNEFQSKNYNNSDYVEYLYKAFLGRGSDAAGKADWVGKLNSGVSRMEVLEGFVRSNEFGGICSSYGIVRG